MRHAWRHDVFDVLSQNLSSGAFYTQMQAKRHVKCPKRKCVMLGVMTFLTFCHTIDRPELFKHKDKQNVVSEWRKRQCVMLGVMTFHGVLPQICPFRASKPQNVMSNAENVSAKNITS